MRSILYGTPSRSGSGRPSGHKSFICVYRNGRGRGAPLRKLTLGTFAEAYTAEQARKDAENLLAAAKSGSDPAMDRRHQRKEETVEELCDLYIAEGLGTKKSTTIATDRGRIERHIKPLLGKKRISAVTQSEIEQFRDALAAGKTKADVKTGKRGRSIVSGGKGTATRTLGLLGGIFGFAVRKKLRLDNPVHGVKRFAPETRVVSQAFSALGRADD